MSKRLLKIVLAAQKRVLWLPADVEKCVPELGTFTGFPREPVIFCGFMACERVYFYSPTLAPFGAVSTVETKGDWLAGLVCNPPVFPLSFLPGPPALMVSGCGV